MPKTIEDKATAFADRMLESIKNGAQAEDCEPFLNAELWADFIQTD